MTAPIDPREIDALYATFEDAYEKAVGRIPFGISPAQMKGNAIYAVARAVLPEGYVAVPVAELQGMVVGITESPWWDSAEDAGETLYAVRDRLNSLIPTEATEGQVPDGLCVRCGGYGLVGVPCDVGFADGPCPDCDGSGEMEEATP